MAKKQFFEESELVFKEKPNIHNFLDLQGSNFGRLIVLGFAGTNKSRNSLWFCRCECGLITKVQSGNLKNGTTTSCGCFMVEQMIEMKTTHGHRVNYKSSPTYASWESMSQRCNNPKYHRYPDYGGRGIQVCQRWLKFENFLADMGERPEGKTLERKENDKGYYPENCKWATVIEQANNKRNNHFLTYEGKTQTIAQWANEIGMLRSVLSSRIHRCWSIEKALTKSIRGIRR